MSEFDVDRLQRQLAAALNVSPSPDLLPRIRERLANEPRSRSRVPYALAAAACVAALVSAVALLPDAPPVPAAVATRVVESAPLPTSAAPVEARSIVPAPQPEQLRPSSDLAAIQEFAAFLDQPHVDAGSLVGDGPEFDELRIADMTFDPITFEPMMFEAW